MAEGVVEVLAHVGEPQEFVEKLAVLIPPPRFYLVRYHGGPGPGNRVKGAADQRSGRPAAFESPAYRSCQAEIPREWSLRTFSDPNKPPDSSS